MIKLIRNAFSEKKCFLDFEDNIINFEYVQNVCHLQEKEGCHLANKLRKQHIFYFKQKMKAKLATQLLSQSVADVLRFCKDTLKIKEFCNAGATITFIELFNHGFDILNKIHQLYRTQKSSLQIKYTRNYLIYSKNNRIHKRLKSSR